MYDISHGVCGKMSTTEPRDVLGPVSQRDGETESRDRDSLGVGNTLGRDVGVVPESMLGASMSRYSEEVHAENTDVCRTEKRKH